MSRGHKGTKPSLTLNGAMRLVISNIVMAERSRGTDRPFNPVTIYIEGTMGVGKSQGMLQACKTVSKILSQDFDFRDIRLAGMVASDIQGIPVPIKAKDFYAGTPYSGQLTKEEAETVMLKWLKDTLLPGIDKSSKKYGILFLDEINQVEDNSIKSLLYQFILDRRINDYVLPDHWYIVAAGNREEDGGVYNRLPAPIRDRMLILNVDPDKDEWVNYFAIPNKVHPCVISFLQKRDSSYFHSYSGENELSDTDCNYYLFATPRSWTMVSDKLYCYESILNKADADYGDIFTDLDLNSAVKGLIGQEIGKEFMEDYHLNRSCNVESIMHLQWQNGQPTSEVTVEENQIPYLANVAMTLDDSKYEEIFKITLYLAHIGVPSNITNMIIDSLSPLNRKRFVEFGSRPEYDGIFSSQAHLATKLTSTLE